MGVTVLACDAAGVRLHAPIAPNINHRSTVFGGSASAVVILAAWTSLHLALRAAELPSRLVIQSNSVDYLAPITGDFDACSAALPAPTLEKFLRVLRRHGKARLEMSATIEAEGKTLVRFRGDYVATRLP